MHILLVEDDAMLAEAVEGGLRQQGWAVDRAGDVSAARLALLDHGYGAVPLSIHEYRTLLALMERRGWVVTRAQLEDSVYGGDGTIESNTIAVYIHQLRRKLGNELIATVHGFGYRIGEPVA